jgi:hypothetical protein
MVDEFGRVGWLERGQVAYILPEKKSQLSEGQIKRVARIHDVFDGLDLDLETGKPMTIERHVELFSCEAPFIEEEISIWEHFVDVFQNELTDRHDDSHHLRGLLYLAIRGCFEAPSLGDALSVYPELKALPDLERVFERVHTPPTEFNSTA